MARPDGHRDPRYLVTTARTHGITALDFVPSMLRQFLDTEGVERCGSLKRIICGGETLDVELRNRCLEVLENVTSHNAAYGPSEPAMDVANWTCRHDDEGEAVPIGRPVANTRLYVLDARLQPVPA